MNKKIPNKLFSSLYSVLNHLNTDEIPDDIRGNYLFSLSSLDLCLLEFSLSNYNECSDDKHKEIYKKRIKFLYDKFSTSAGFYDLTEVGHYELLKKVGEVLNYKHEIVKKLEELNND